MKKKPSIQKKLFCHKFLIEELIKLETSNKLPNKIILSGQKGVGKATLAYHLINFVLSKNEDYSYNHMYSYYLQNYHPLRSIQSFFARRFRWLPIQINEKKPTHFQKPQI